MTRTNVYTYDEYAGPQFAGWYDSDVAERFRGDSRWNGSNNIYIDTGEQCDFVGYALHRTSGGRWVLVHNRTRYHNGPCEVTYMPADTAEVWLIRNGHTDAAERYFGEVAAEAEIAAPGRPAITDTRFTASLTAAQHAWIVNQDGGGAPTIRRLIDAAMAGADDHAVIAAGTAATL